MPVPQPGILALGNPAHAYLEFDGHAGADAATVVATAAGLTPDHRTMDAYNLVLGFRPRLWAQVRPGELPDGAADFADPVVGPDGFTMPATQHDVTLWIAGGAQDVVFDAATAAIAALSGVARLADETTGWSYQRDRDLTGFIDGTENPPLVEAPALVGVPSILLLQKWVHDTAAWTALGTAAQEQAIGRTKPDSVELDDKPETAHAARTDQETYGDVFRRNTAYGSASDHGTMFVGFCARQEPLAAMLRSMAGLDGPRDALTRYTTPLTGAYYVVPGVDALTALAGSGH